MQCLVGGHSDEYKIYWSSTESPLYGNAWAQVFTKGSKNYQLKDGYYLGVRAIRAFNNSSTQSLNSVEEAESLGDSSKEGSDLKHLHNVSVGISSQRMQESVKQEEPKQFLFSGGKEL